MLFRSMSETEAALLDAALLDAALLDAALFHSWGFPLSCKYNTYSITAPRKNANKRLKIPDNSMFGNHRVLRDHIY